MKRQQNQDNQKPKELEHLKKKVQTLQNQIRQEQIYNYNRQQIQNVKQQIINQINQKTGHTQDSDIQRIDLQDLCNIISNKKTNHKCNVQIIIKLWQICPDRDDNGKIKIQYLAQQISNFLFAQNNQQQKIRIQLIKLLNIKNKYLIKKYFWQLTKNQIYKNVSWFCGVTGYILFYDKLNFSKLFNYFANLFGNYYNTITSNNSDISANNTLDYKNNLLSSQNITNLNQIHTTNIVETTKTFSFQNSILKKIYQKLKIHKKYVLLGIFLVSFSFYIYKKNSNSKNDKRKHQYCI